MQIHVIALSSDIVEDCFDEGEGNSTGCGYQGQAIGKSFQSMEAAIGYLSSYYGYSPKSSDWEIGSNLIETSKMVANHSEAQNGGWFEPTTSEISKWKRGKMKLYSENVSVRYLVH